jgi:hypothetical protein
MSIILADRGISEHLIPMSLRPYTHVLLTQSFDMAIDIHFLLLKALATSHLSVQNPCEEATYKLLRQRNLLKLHLVNASYGGAEHCASG